MKIDGNLYSIWYENEQGVRYVPDLNNPGGIIVPEDFFYQHSDIPGYVTYQVLECARSQKVIACSHPESSVKPTGGWIEGIEGRECIDCLGTQTRKVDGPWPTEWNAGSSKRVYGGSSGFSSDLVLAMTRPTPTEQELAIVRAREPGYDYVVPREESVGEVMLVSAEYAAKTGAKVGDKMVARGPGPRLYSLYEATLIASRACERCLNVLLWEYGCNDGYQHGSTAYRKANTSCLFCKPVETVYEAQVRAAVSA